MHLPRSSPLADVYQIWYWVGVADIIICDNFFGDRLRGGINLWGLSKISRFHRQSLSPLTVCFRCLIASDCLFLLIHTWDTRHKKNLLLYCSKLDDSHYCTACSCRVTICFSISCNSCDSTGQVGLGYACAVKYNHRLLITAVWCIIQIICRDCLHVYLVFLPTYIVIIYSMTYEVVCPSRFESRMLRIAFC